MRGRVELFILITGIVLLTLIVYWNGLKDYLKTGVAVFAWEAAGSSPKDKHAAEHWPHVNMSTSRRGETEPRSFSSNVSQVYSSNRRNITIIKTANMSVSSNKSTIKSRNLKDATNTSFALTKRIKDKNTADESEKSKLKPVTINNTTFASIITVSNSGKSQNRTTTAVYVSLGTKTIRNTTAVITLDKLPNRTAENSKRKVVSIHSGNVSSTADGRTAVAEKTDNGSSIEKEQNVTLYIFAHHLTNGRLGNQMFRYASLLGIARAQGRVLIVPSGSDLQNTFKLHQVGDLQETRGWPVISEEHCFAFDKRLLNLTRQNVSIAGFLQSHRYFHDYADDVRQEFVFADSVANKADLIVHDLISKRKGSLFVGVHLRRSDFLGQHQQELGYGVPGKSYFLKAFDWMQSKFPNRNITYLVASDDLDWCKENLSSENVLPLPSASPAVHMAILSTCDHVIISGGTYGWWSAWLAGGYVIYFKGYMSKGTVFGDKFTPENYYPSLWVGMGN